MQKRAIIIYGPPGAGKGTQANLLACKDEYVHFDTGKYLEEVVHDPAHKKNKIIQRERKLFDGGKLMTPAFVLKVVRDKTTEIAKAGFHIVYSGSPRTMFETFGDARNEGLIAHLGKLYGKKNIHVVYLDVHAGSSVTRNANRKLCALCGFAMIYSKETAGMQTCPLHGEKLRTRTLDKPTVIKVRLKEFKERTFPILAALKKRGYKIKKINGEPLPYKVHENVLRHIV